MRWEGGEQSGNVEDRRSAGGAGGMLGGRGLSMGTLVIAVIAAMIFGVNPLQLLGMLSGGPMQVQQSPQTESASPQSAANDRDLQFTRTVLRDTEMVWDKLFRDAGGNYIQPKLVLFSGYTPTACGTGQSAMGPFYCPLDQKVYLDTSFFRDLKERFRAPGEFAQAYVIAHEVGHHVQNLLGISDKVREAQQGVSQSRANALSVRLELQADCFAGVWGNRADAAKRIIEPGEVEQALTAATAIGDDRLQRQAQGRIVPESFTHGTSEQRVRWFKRGLETGDLRQCDTFKASTL